MRAASSKFEEERGRAFGKAAEALVTKAVTELAEAFQDDGEEVLRYFAEVAAALITDWHHLAQSDRRRGDDDDDGPSEGNDSDPEHARDLERFKVNLLVSHEPGAAPPVIYEANPTFPNLFGYLERRARFGALLTDFTRMRAGSIHRASGGVLIVRAQDLLTDPMIWERMKRVLRERQIGPEDPLGPLGLYATTLRPVRVPIKLRVVLLGPEEMYSALLAADPDFAALFRVKVEALPRSAHRGDVGGPRRAYHGHGQGARWGTFTREARAKLIDLSARLLGAIASACRSFRTHRGDGVAAFCPAPWRRPGPPMGPGAHDGAHAGDPGVPSLRRPFRASIAPAHRERGHGRRSGLLWRERRAHRGRRAAVPELIVRGEIALDTSGSRVGVINGLSVLSTGDVEFGQPVRITAVVALGREGLVDVEREVQLLRRHPHKGVARVLRGYLGRMFGQERPLSLRGAVGLRAELR